MSNNVKNNVTTKTLAEMNEEFAEAVAKAEFSASVKREVARRHRASVHYHRDMMNAAIDRAVAKIYSKSRFTTLKSAAVAANGIKAIPGLTEELLAPEAPEVVEASTAPTSTAPTSTAPSKAAISA